MKTYGLVGFPISHSFSQKYFTEKFKRENISSEFKNFPLQDIKQFPHLIKSNPGICGLSITIPHKQNVIKFLDALDESAEKVGAVNCIKRRKMEDGRWKMEGYNTDSFGFEHSLKPLLKPHHSHALVLGTGGAAKAVAYILGKLKIKFKLVSRKSNHFSYQDISPGIIGENLLIINASPAGMFPNVNDCPKIPYEHLTAKHFLYDLTYNPEETLFLKKGKEKGAQIKNGLEMLHLQAEKAWEIWNKAPNP